jgi:amino acid transporter
VSELRRELGKWDLTAIGVNQVIGGSVFALAAPLALNTGSWSPWLVAGVAFATLLIALSFAEVASRFEGTGGSYLYTRAAFMTAIIGTICGINIRGIKQSSLVVNVLTVAKLLPLLIFSVVGILYVDWAAFATPASVTPTQLSAASLLLIFAFGGYEVVPVMGGETKEPRSMIPFALIMTIVLVATITIVTQVVAYGTLPGIATSRTPLADSAAIFMGAAGAAMITIGAVFSTSGNNMGQALSGSRSLFALAEQGDLPRWFGYVHPGYRTPVTAIVVTSVVSLVLAVTGSFATMAAASAISRLLVYVATCASQVRLRSAAFAGKVQPAKFILPAGPLIPSLAIAISMMILVFATTRQLVAGGVALAVGAVLFLIATGGSNASARS